MKSLSALRPATRGVADFWKGKTSDRFSESRDQGCKKLVDIVRIYSADETSKRRKNLVV